MSDNDGHRLIRRLLDRLAAKKPPQVAITLYASSGPDLSGTRGFVKGFARPQDFTVTPPPPPAGGGAGSLPSRPPGTPGAGAGAPPASSAPQIFALRIGDYLHIAVESPEPWYLNLYNLGTSGRICRLFPTQRDQARQIMSGTPQYITPMNGFSPYLGNAECFRETGPLNEHPERFLVFVTRERMDLPIERLCPELGSPSRASRAGAGNPWEQGSTRMESLFENELPPADWEWGALEVPVKRE